MVLRYSCQKYWSLLEKDTNEGITVEVFSDVISTGFFSSTSIMGFYLGVCLTVGTIWRTFVLYKTDRIFICDARDTGKIRNLIACIYRQRLEQNLKREEELYFLLYEIIRSPELFKHLTGSSIRVPLEEGAKTDANLMHNQPSQSFAAKRRVSVMNTQLSLDATRKPSNLETIAEKKEE